MTREEAKGYLMNISYQLGTTSIEYLSEKDGEKMREAINTLEQEPCEDCISRADAIEFFKDDDYVVNELKNLAPVTPTEKVGKWIYMDDDNLPNRNCHIMNTYRFECSKCRRSVIVPNWESVLAMFPYCNCGCKMVDIEKDNTRYDEFGFIDPFSFREDGKQNECNGGGQNNNT